RDTSVLKTNLALFGLLVATVVAPLRAEDYSKLAFNIGGGIMTPLAPTANYVGLSGNFAVGAGYNINKKNAILAEFQWNGMPTNTVLHPPSAPFGNVNLYSITPNYRYSINSIGG